MQQFLASLTDISQDIITLLVALVLGGVVGIQRELSGHEAGFRTNTLVCVGSALAMLVSIHMHIWYGGDAGRIAALCAAMAVGGGCALLPRRAKRGKRRVRRAHR